MTGFAPGQTLLISSDRLIERDATDVRDVRVWFAYHIDRETCRVDTGKGSVVVSRADLRPFRANVSFA